MKTAHRLLLLLPLLGVPASLRAQLPLGPQFQVNVHRQLTAGPLIPVAGGASYGPVVAMGPGGEFVVVWETLNGGTDPGGRIRARRYGPGSLPRGEEILVSDHFGSILHAAKDGAGNFLVTWTDFPTSTESRGVYGRRFSATGVPYGEAMPLVPTFTLGHTDLAMVPDGSFVLVWDGVGGQVFTADGVAPRPIFVVPQAVAGSQGNPRVAINGMGRFVVVWQNNNVNISGRRFKARRP
jgi:hypothetical protein